MNANNENNENEDEKFVTPNTRFNLSTSTKYNSQMNFCLPIPRLTLA